LVKASSKGLGSFEEIVWRKVSGEESGRGRTTKSIQ